MIKLNSVLLGASLLLGSSVASAAVVTTVDGSEGQIADAILNLDVNGIFYTVNFAPNTANGVYGTAPRTYDFDNLSDAQAANAAIIAALNESLASLVGDGIEDLNNSQLYYIGYTDNGDPDISDPANGDVTAVLGMGGAPESWENVGTNVLSAGTQNIYANFTISEVPVPAAVWLFGSGLLGLIGVAKRKKA